MIDLADKPIIITGASSGIGAATAIECARVGMPVLLNARRGERLGVVAQQVRALGCKAEIVAGDVADPAVTSAMLHRAQQVFGGFHAVFANAGYGLEKSVVDTTMDEWRRIFEVNFFASVECVQAAALRLIEQEQPGHLLMCSSCVARIPLPFFAAYSASKAAQAQVCSSMQSEMKPHGIAVSSVHPVSTRTEFFEVAHRSSGKPGDAASEPDHTPQMFIQPPQRVARAVVRCLQRPRPEVWTSFITRASSAAMVLMPRFGKSSRTSRCGSCIQNAANEMSCNQLRAARNSTTSILLMMPTTCSMSITTATLS